MGLLKKLAAAYADDGYDRWHTPGHKGEMCAADITELMDGGYFPGDAVLLAQDGCAKVYGAKQLRFLTGGSSMGIKAALIAANCDIVTGSNNHRAVAEGLQLIGRQAHIVQNTVKDFLPQPLTPEQVRKALLSTGAGAVLALTPDYYGLTASLELRAAADECGALLIADSAHGAHFAAHPQLACRCFASIADFCNLSAHKTLSAYTQSAYLCVNNDAYVERTDEALRLLGTTSPNYVMFAALEDAAAELATLGGEYERLRLAREKLGADVLLPNDDFTRIVIRADKFGTDGRTLAKKLAENKIMAEMYDAHYVVLIATPRDDDAKFERLAAALTRGRGAHGEKDER